MRYLVGLITVAILLAAVSCERWKYKECRKVGHSALYCVTQIGGGRR
jgi:hypothetical protein